MARKEVEKRGEKGKGGARRRTGENEGKGGNL